MKRRSEFVFSLEWLIRGIECTVGACRIVKLPSMPKLYLGPGLSQRVHRALRQRLERFMANAAAPAETAFPVSENPPMPAQTGTVDMESEKEGRAGRSPFRGRHQITGRQGRQGRQGGKRGWKR